MVQRQASKRVVLSYLQNVSAGEGKKYDPEQLKIGIKIEKEHKNVYDAFKKALKENGQRMPMSIDEFAEMVAKAHLDEVPDYYDKLMKHVEPEGHKEAMDFSSIAPMMTPEQIMDDRELSRAVRLAIAAEQDAASLYEVMADSSENEDAKEVFQNIANEEKVHIFELQKLLENINPDETDFRQQGDQEVEELLDK